MAAWLMMKDLGYGLGAPWIGYSMLFGLVSITGSFLRAFSNSKGRLFNAMAAVGFALSIASAVLQNEGINSPELALALAIVPGGIAAWFLPANSDSHPPETLQESVVRGFKWMAWVEGATVLVLFLLYIPAKKILDVNLDGGTGLIGWTHGVFVVVYVLSLTFTYRQLKWTFFQYFMGGFASFFPFGTIIFERKMFRSQE
jgi:integral membrane protein